VSTTRVAWSAAKVIGSDTKAARNNTMVTWSDIRVFCSDIAVDWRETWVACSGIGIACSGKTILKKNWIIQFINVFLCAI
jgi:hypothetical protein